MIEDNGHQWHFMEAGRWHLNDPWWLKPPAWRVLVCDKCLGVMARSQADFDGLVKDYMSHNLVTKLHIIHIRKGGLIKAPGPCRSLGLPPLV